MAGEEVCLLEYCGEDGFADFETKLCWKTGSGLVDCEVNIFVRIS